MKPLSRIPALTPVNKAAERLGVNVRGFKTAVNEGRIGGCWLVEIGGEDYVHTAYLEHFIAGKPEPATPAEAVAILKAAEEDLFAADPFADPKD